jgi:hypothetical protein
MNNKEEFHKAALEFVAAMKLSGQVTLSIAQKLFQVAKMMVYFEFYPEVFIIL